MKKVFVSHPFRNNPTENMKAIAEICRNLAEKGEVMPISPVHAFAFLDDTNPDHRELALGYCAELIAVCDKLWLYGDWENSEGCQMEASFAYAWGIEVVEMETKLSPAAEHFIGGDKTTTREELDSYYKGMGIIE